MNRNREWNRSVQNSFALVVAMIGFSASVLHAGTTVPSYGTYFGGTGDVNASVAIAIDPSGNVIIAGYTTSQTLPGTANAFQPRKAPGFPNNTDVYVAKFDPTGQALLWSTFLGGNSNEVPTGIAVDSTGSIYVVGSTASSDFPAGRAISCVPTSAFGAPPVAFQQQCSTGLFTNSGGGFLVKLGSDGRSLLYSLGTPGSPNVNYPTLTVNNPALIINSQGEAFVGVNSVGSLFLLRINVSGTGLIYGAYLGGGSPSKLAALALDSSGNCYVVGTATTYIPTTANALQKSNPNLSLTPNVGNGFILVVNPTGTQLVYGTWFGPQYFETIITSIAVNGDGSLYFAGVTNSTTLQATPGAYQGSPGGGFVAKLTLGSTSLTSLSYLPVPVPTDVCTNCQSVVMKVNNQAREAYVTWTGFSGPSQLLKMTLPTLGASASPLGLNLNFPLSLGMAATSPSSLWLAGGCQSCTFGNLISSNAFQTSPSSTGSNGFLLQLVDISPTISTVVNSAAGTSLFAAGQLISVYGAELGPTTGTVAQVNSNGAVTNSSGGTQVLFDGVAAPIMYAGANQVNTVVPCSVAGRFSTQVTVSYRGAQSPSFTLVLASAAPGIFTSDGSGKGQAAVLNQDYSFNGPANPAPRGSAVTFYATGIGVTSPCVDGQTYQSNFPRATLPVVVGVGNEGAQVLYAGQAPYFISGAAQINVAIPSDGPTGIVPLTLVVGGIFSPPGVTIAVK